ncbi:DUF4258 domain-containing protein [Candidatus Daviesbacteria bacterium]|nr:DUF4258 domain-containing protein [Candidatus Daviesbacteria bacterium]
MDTKIIREKIIKSEFDLSEHAHKERQIEQITIKEIEQTILENDIIEKYPKDPRGPSCLIGNASLHVVCGFRNARLLVVTVYPTDQ